MAVERDELAERIRLAEAARRVVRFATSQDDLESVLDDCRHPLLEGFRADFLAIRTYQTGSLPAAGSPPLERRRPRSSQRASATMLPPVPGTTSRS